MIDSNTAVAAAPAVAVSRRRGAPPGNRNAVTHGRRTMEARSARAAARARINSRLTKVADGLPPARCKGGIPPSSFSANKPNNSVAAAALPAQQKKRGAPKRNGNALKHGLRTAEMTRLRRETRLAIAKMRLLTRLAHEFVLLRAMERKAAKRGSTSSGIDDEFPFSESLARLARSGKFTAKFLQDGCAPDG
jgi:uncharacterized protein YjcR